MRPSRTSPWSVDRSGPSGRPRFAALSVPALALIAGCANAPHSSGYPRPLQGPDAAALDATVDAEAAPPFIGRDAARLDDDAAPSPNLEDASPDPGGDTTVDGLPLERADGGGGSIRPDVAPSGGSPDAADAAPVADAAPLPDAAPPPPPVSTLARVYLLAGQSNMVGYGRLAELPPELARPATDVRIHAEGMVDAGLAGRWGRLAPGFGPTVDRFGPELTFGLRQADLHPGRRVHLIKHAVGNASLTGAWNPDGGAEYAAFLDHVERALDDLRAEGLTPELVGLVWMQGEADALDAAAAADYGPHLTAFIERLRLDLRASSLPVVVGRISTAREWTHNGVVRDAQAQVAEAVPATDAVETSDLQRDFGHSDPLHYNTEGQRTLGERFADAWEALVPSHYDQAADFSTVNGECFWTSLASDAGAASPMQPGGDRLVGPTPDVWVGAGEVHPDVAAAEILWRAPGTGTLHVTGDVSDAEPDCGDGVLVEIRTEGRAVWGPLPLGPGAEEPAAFDVEIPLAGQSGVLFRTESLGNAECDRTTWRLSAEFTWAP